MAPDFVLAAAGGWYWEWMYLAVPLAIYSVCVLALFGFGRTDDFGNVITFFFRQISNSLERVTGMAGWSMAGVLSGLMMLLIAVIGFYWDVAWHVDRGRDDQLFTPSHVMILVGLGGLIYSAVVSVIFASLERADVGFRVLGVRVPWSALLLGTLGIGGVAAFPLDNLWHEAYGIDVTLWSPSHLQLVGGGSFATLALWLMIAEALPSSRPNLLGRLIHVVTGGATLVGMTTFEGEFDFGVPGFQGLFLPLLIMAAAGFTLVFARAALGPWGAVKVVLAYLVIRGVVSVLVGEALGHTFPRFPLYVPSALAVEAGGLLAGTARRLKFGLVSGALVGTVGLAGELAWVDLSGWFPPAAVLLPKVALFGPLVALATAVLAVGLARAFAPGERAVPVPALAIAGVVLLGALAYPLPRRVGDVEALIRLEPRGERALVKIELDPPDAARNAYAFGVTSWQGGGTVHAALEEVAPGRFVADKPVPVTGKWKTSVGLMRDDEVMAAPVYLPADPEIGASEVPALPQRRVAFQHSTEVLMREAHGGPAWPAILAYSGLGTLVALWVVLMTLTARRVPGRRKAAPPVETTTVRSDAAGRVGRDRPGSSRPIEWAPGGWHGAGGQPS